MSILGEMVDLRSGTGEVQDKHGTSYHGRNTWNAQIVVGKCNNGGMDSDKAK